MSVIENGLFIRSDLSKNARGGTELMAERLIKYVDPTLLKNVQIHVSRPSRNAIKPNMKQILWCHDLVNDPESRVLADGGWRRFAKVVFVSHWQRDLFMLAYGIPYSHCTVIENAIEREFVFRPKTGDTVNFIYHTTPHRGLQLLYPVFDALSKEYKNIHLDVFSSFEVYGWKERDKAYAGLFDSLRKHPKITYHGARPNADVLSALDKAHVFLYPCIWQETSCIAMIEAIKSGVLAIHPSLAALPETASECTVMYDYTEDKQQHMQRAYTHAKAVLDNGGVDFVNQVMCNTGCELPRNSVSSFSNKWNALLEQVTR